MRAVSWLDSEPGGQEMVEDLRRLARRNRNHPWPLLLLVLVATLLGVLRGYLHKPAYEARIALRILETDLGLETRPRPAAELRAWVTTVALSDGNLMRVIERYNPYPRARLRGMDQALEELRDDIEVDVWRNEFLSEDPNDVLGRAARVAISYKHGDAGTAWSVVEALVKATVEEQRQMRRAQVEYMTRGLDPALQQARDTLRERQAELAEALRQSAVSRAAGLQALRLRSDVESLEQDVNRLRATRDEAQLRLQMENLDLGLQADIIDSRRPQPRPFRTRQMLLYGLVAAVLSALLGGVVLKAFDRHIYDAEDLRRLGYSVWGALPAYAGDDIGSMQRRLRGAKASRAQRGAVDARAAAPRDEVGYTQR